MFCICENSKRQPDLLCNSSSIEPKFSNLCIGENAEKKIMDGPAPLKSTVQHPLQSQSAFQPSLLSVIEMRRNVGGNAQGEKFIDELNAASQFNRGPAGFSNSSRVHFDMLLGRDDKLSYGDYLNYDYDAHL